MPPLLEVRNAQRRVRVDLALLQQFSERALHLILKSARIDSGDLQKLRAVSVVFLSDRRMAALHRQFMNMKGATDVITFQHGEIVVSVETAQRNAIRFDTSAREEIKLYIVHGLLHLAGFAETTAAKARKMEAIQGRVVAAANLAAEAQHGGRGI